MKTVSIYFLAFLVLWMSTWMVTDIHDWSSVNADEFPFIFSERNDHGITGNHDSTHDDHHDLDCGVCSYDHGGHIGQALATLPFVAESISSQNSIDFPLHPAFWYSRNTSPKLRPPIV